MAVKSVKEKHFIGLGVSPGIGIGTAHVRDRGSVSVREYRVPSRLLKAELDRFKAAIRRTRRQFMALRKKALDSPDTADDDLVLLLDAYLQMLEESRLVRGAEHRIRDGHINAEAAVQAEVDEIAAGFAALEDAYIAARIADIREVADRLLRNLTRTRETSLSRLPKWSVVVADELSPADTARLSPQRVAGIAAMSGGAEGHTKIMARALSLPAVLGAPGLLEGVRSGDTVVVDGDAGHVIVNPTSGTLTRYTKRREERLREKRVLSKLRRQPAVTRDRVEVKLMANVELPLEMAQVRQSGAEGIGLLRTEFVFMNRNGMPEENEQYRVLSEMVSGMNGRPVTIRTLDVGGDKISDALIGDFGESVSSPLGLRGIRLSLSRAEILETQFRAILRAANHGPVRILLPMVTTVSEVRRAREALSRAARSLERQGVTIPHPLPPCGIMIEVPAAALAADGLARVSDFFAIGSNDLTMYTLATDRSDQQVAQYFDSLHPAVLRLMQFAAEAGLRARIPISICGEMAGDPRYTALLLGLGFRELSMTSASIPRVKHRIRALDLSAANQRARLIMDQVDGGRIATLLDDFNALA